MRLSKEILMSNSKWPNPANVAPLFCVRILQPLLDPIQGWSRFYSGSWAELLCNPHLNNLIWKAGGFYPGTSGSAAFKGREQEENGLRWMWSEWRIKHVVNSDTPSPGEKVTHSFKAWKDSITTTVMLVCYNSLSEPEYHCFDYHGKFGSRFCPPLWLVPRRQEAAAGRLEGRDMEGCK